MYFRVCCDKRVKDLLVLEERQTLFCEKTGTNMQGKDIREFVFERINTTCNRCVWEARLQRVGERDEALRFMFMPVVNADGRYFLVCIGRVSHEFHDAPSHAISFKVGQSHSLMPTCKLLDLCLFVQSNSTGRN